MPDSSDYDKRDNRITLGAIRGNTTQHRRAKHNGEYDKDCATCKRLDDALAYYSK